MTFLWNKLWKTWFINWRTLCSLWCKVFSISYINKHERTETLYLDTSCSVPQNTTRETFQDTSGFSTWSLACPQDNNFLGCVYFTISLEPFCETEAFGLLKIWAVWQQGTTSRSAGTLARSGADSSPRVSSWLQTSPQEASPASGTSHSLPTPRYSLVDVIYLCKHPQSR